MNYPALDISGYTRNLADHIGSLDELVREIHVQFDQMRQSPDVQDDIMTICFHTFSYKGEEFFLWPGDGVMLVDAMNRHDYIAETATLPTRTPGERTLRSGDADAA